MGRRHRDLDRSDWYHVVNRGVDRQDIVSSDGDRALLEQLTAEAFDRHGVELHAYVVMSNHVHQLVRAPDTSLSLAMQRLFSRYASAYNERVERDGPLFSGRFFSEPITSEAQLHQTGRYIHRNPLAFVPPAALANYRWSSLRPLVGRSPVPPWLSTGTLLGDGVTQEEYLADVLRPQPGDRFPAGHLPALTATSCEQIDAAVAAVACCDPVEIRKPMRRTDVDRVVAIALAVELRAGAPTEIAAHYGLSDQRSVRRIAARGRVQRAQSEAFADLRQRVLRQLDAA